MLSEEQKAKYLEDPHHCPFCGSEDYEGSSIDVDNGYCSQKITCSECGEGWWDIYRLVDIEECDQ